MSSSPALGLKKEVQAQPFSYADAAASVVPQLGKEADGAQPALSNALHEQEIQEARREGESRARQAFEEELERVRGNIRTALAKFEKERAAYFQKVETEVVQLALSIARKVLYREAQVDPLVLAGIVRVALDKIESNTKVVIRVHPLYAADCRAFFAHGLEPHAVPEIEEDPAVEPEQCVLQTELGTTELGIEVQLKEIEKGLVDLLAQRPPMERS
jgi:flagellar assembly protein FliH